MSEDFRLSVSKSKVWDNCRKQYEYNYVLKFPKKERDYHISGKFCHLVLEEFHKAYMEGCVLPFNLKMSEAWKVAWAEYKEKMTADMKKDCWDIINNYLRNISNTMLPNVIGVERRFEINIGENVILNGAIDLTQIDGDDVLHIADFKTTKNKKYLVSDMFQLLTYGLVILSEQPELKKFRGSYILLRHGGERITKDFSIKEIMAVKEKLLSFARNIRKETEFKATPNNLCGWCDYLEHCVEGKTKVAGNSFSGKNVYGEVGYGN